MFNSKSNKFNWNKTTLTIARKTRSLHVSLSISSSRKCFSGHIFNWKFNSKFKNFIKAKTSLKTLMANATRTMRHIPRDREQIFTLTLCRVLIRVFFFFFFLWWRLWQAYGTLVIVIFDLTRNSISCLLPFSISLLVDPVVSLWDNYFSHQVENPFRYNNSLRIIIQSSSELVFFVPYFLLKEFSTIDCTRDVQKGAINAANRSLRSAICY